MTTRKGERTSRMNERDSPHLVEMPVPSGGLGSRLDAMHDWHRERGIRSYQGHGRYEEPLHYITWCFADAETADAFKEAFGGVRKAAKPK